jgi:ABC-2 type transport system permease protein
MGNLSLLLSPRVVGIKNTFIRPGGKRWKKPSIIVFIAVLFWGALFVLSCRVLSHFQSVDVIGDLLARYLLGMVLLTFFSLLIFSHVVTALSNLYLSSDLELCHSSPSSLVEIFSSRAVYTIIDSSWMVMVFGLPVIMAYAYVYRPGAGFYLTLLHMGPATGLIAAGLGILIAMVLVSIFPAQRTRDIVALLSVFLIAVLYLLFRFLRPERLVNPEAFFSILQYMNALKAADSPYLPTHWLAESLWSYLSPSGGEGRLFNVGLSWSTALALLAINVWVAGKIYFQGFSKAQEAKRRRGGKVLLDLLVKVVRKPFKEDLASIAEKDVRAFFRDNTQWSQLLLLAALVVVYLYNFSVLPLDRSPLPLGFLRDNIAFLNVGLAGFVITAISVRFVFPAVSSEGRAFWILRSSPVPLKRLLWGKFALSVLPMILLGETLILMTNYLLRVSFFMMLLSAATMIMVVLGIVGLGIGLGALYPKFSHQNIAQVSTGFGGLMFMMTGALYLVLIIVLEAGPVYMLSMSELKGDSLSLLQWSFIVLSFLAVLALSAFAVYKPMNMGLKALSELE